jgi:PAS domain S-box-containing protein
LLSQKHQAVIIVCGVVAVQIVIVVLLLGLPAGARDIRMLAAVVGVLIAVGAVGVSFAHSLDARTQELANKFLENSLRLRGGQTLMTLVSGTDGFANADRAFHSMAQELNDALEKLKRSEASVRTIIESLPVGLITVGESLVIEYVNEAAEHLIGAASGELQGQLLSTLFAGCQPAEAQKLVQILQRQGELSNFPCRIGCHQSHLIDVELSTTRLQQGETVRYLFALVDVSAKNELARIKRDFTNMISHDIRTPLTSLMATLQFARRGAFGELSEEGRSRLQTDESNIAYVVNLINDLLDMERVQDGQFDILPACHDLSDIVQKSVSVVQGLARAKAVELNVETLPQISLYVDKQRVVQALVNLLSNAIKFSRDNSTVEIAIKPVPEQSVCEIAVIDHGRGIPQDKQKMLFERFRQVEAGDAERGFGLGLVITRHIAEAHGGAVRIQSQPGEGSRFSLILPTEPTKELSRQ